MIAYKLLYRRKDGTYGPLFFNRSQRLLVGVWYQAETHHHRKGFAYHPGWHACAAPTAPHLALMPNRVWCEVEITCVKTFPKPARNFPVQFLEELFRPTRSARPVFQPTYPATGYCPNCGAKVYRHWITGYTVDEHKLNCPICHAAKLTATH